MTAEEVILLKLLRFYLVRKPKDDSIVCSETDWNAIFTIAKQQGVSAIVLDAIDLLNAQSRPSESVLIQWIKHSVMTGRNYIKHADQIHTLADFYNQYGIRVLLLKGYGCSLCYPTPEHRPSGDIDIYLFGMQTKADELVEKELGIKVYREYHKHSIFKVGGIEVENHAKFIDDISHKSNIKYEQILMSVLQKEECSQSPIDNVWLPSPTFNALFLLRHTGEHFAANEIKLRHILDVGLFFQRFHSQIDRGMVYKVYKEERMMRFFNAIATICVEYLGLNAACFASDGKQYSYKSDISLAERVLSDIFMKKDVLPMTTAGINTIDNKLKYAIDKGRRWWRNRWKYQLVYNESLAESFWWLTKNRMKASPQPSPEGRGDGTGVIGRLARNRAF